YSVSCGEEIGSLSIPNPFQRYPIHLALHKILDGTRESKRFWETNYKEVVGYWVPDASSDQREKVVSYLRQQMGEPYDWSSSKTNYDEWYCTKLPYVGYKVKASIDIDSNGGYWVTPDNIADDEQTHLFMRSEG
ncbi:hypothetical protein ABEV40_18120, partial [Geobacillus thermocatenulatus]